VGGEAGEGRCIELSHEFFLSISCDGLILGETRVGLAFETEKYLGGRRLHEGYTRLNEVYQ
jgi:hypothetical protein